MREEPPPLSDSDDPFEVLAVPRGTSGRELRRAYVRLIKIYRPEHHPVEFQRIHAAYENARTHADLFFTTTEHGADPKAARTDPRSPSTDQLADEMQRIWRRVAAGDVDVARQSFRAAQERSPREEVLHAHAALLERLLNDPAWEEAPWSYLRELPDRPAATAMFRQRLIALLLSPPLSAPPLSAPPLPGAEPLQESARRLEAVAAVTDEGFLDDAAEDPELRQILMMVRAACRWRSPQLAADLSAHDHLSLELIDDGQQEDERDHWAREQGALWRKWSARHTDLSRLIDFVELGPLLDAEESGRLARALSRDLRRRFESYFEALIDLQHRAPRMLDCIAETVQMERLPLNKELDESSKQRIRDQLLSVNGRLQGSLLQQYTAVLTVVLIVALLEPFLWIRELGWWLVLIIPGSMLTSTVGAILVSSRVYRRSVREPVARLIHGTGHSPAQVDAALDPEDIGFAELRQHRTDIKTDPVLQALYWIGQLRHSDPPEPIANAYNR